MTLFEPITIRGMTIRNRIVMSSMGVGLGYTNKRVTDFYVERARGGVGAIIIGAGIPDLFMNDEAWGKPGAVATFIKRMQGLTSAVNDAGARIGIQFIYGNRYPLGLDMLSGELVAPSARIQQNPSSHAFIKPGESLRELAVSEIAIIIDKIARAAAGAREAGFNFVELHNGHGMLHCQFFSPTTNRRTDKYGGDPQKRMTFGIETVEAMRSAVGEDFPISVRHGAVDVVPGGATLDEGVRFAVELEKAGADILNVSLATPPFCGGYVPAGEDPEGTHIHLAEAVKKRVNVPVIGVGRIKTPEVAKAVIAQGKADMVALGRQLFADPLWPEKVFTGKGRDIVPCIDCHECYEHATAGNGLECTVNYRAGREKERDIQPAEKKKRVLVIGGGPAGMEAARVAAQRGHQVTLHESGRQLGGAMLLQAVVPAKAEVEKLTRYLSEEIRRHDVMINGGKAFTTDSPAAADVAVIATGASPVRPDIPGIDREKVISSGDIRKLLSSGSRNGGGRIRSGWQGLLIRCGSALLGRPMSLSLRKRVARIGIPLIFGKSVLIIGGNLMACQLADLLAEHGRKVTVVAQDEEFATDMISTLRYRLVGRLEKRGVTLICGVRSYEEIGKDAIAIVDRDGFRQLISSDSIVPMVGFRPNDELSQRLAGRFQKMFVAGDCAAPDKLLHAIHDGARVGREI